MRRHPWVKGIQVRSNEGSCPFPNGYTVIVKLKWQPLKTVSRATGTLSAKLGTKHPWVKGNQVCSKEGPCPLLSWYNIEAAKIQKYIDILKKYFPELLG